MLIAYIFRNPVIWIIPLIIQASSYVKILKKMGKREVMGIIPVLGEMEMSADLFRNMRSFWRPAIVTAAMFLTVRYIGSGNTYGLVMNMVALIVYGVFLAQLYYRLARQFGKGMFFALGLIFVPLVFLPVLAFGKSAYLGKPAFKPEKELKGIPEKLRKAAVVAFTILELTVLVTGCFFITVIVRPFRPVAKYLMNDTINKLSTVTDTDEIIGRDTTLGDDYVKIADAQRSRDYFFPDHSSDKKVVVMEYIIGSNLEDGKGCASMNIAQMKDATAKGDGLDFVVQAGGSERWFTKGIDDSSVGRYVISGGELSLAEKLCRKTTMSDPKNLTDFIKWTKENYPADRYMLVLWDHGGGFAYGYGEDDLNKRADGESLMSASEIIGAVREADVKFDLIGFDACLMQNVEYANAFEAYADYYLASEESEPGTGWYYTAGFGKLAEDPTLSTEEFGKSMVSSYDQCNRKMNEGEANHTFTLSLVDLTLVKSVYENLINLYTKAAGDITDNPAVYANMSAGRSNAYQFGDEEQVDMVGYLYSLKKADYKQQVMTDEELDKIAESAKACVVYRNSDSAEGINGLAIDFPYKNIYNYSDEYRQLKAVNYKEEQKFFDIFCSIMGAQQMSKVDKDSFWGSMVASNYKNEDWYIEGFEDYDTTDLFVDIPVIETENGYLPELPDKTWDTILDCKVAAYLLTDEGVMYIGQEHFADEDETGRPLVSMDGVWAHINGQVVCYEAEDPLITEDGTVYRGTVRGRLNGEENIILHVEWNPVTEETDDFGTGYITGYTRENEKQSFFLKKGLEQFETGDTVEFLYDFYDEEGNLIRTDTYGSKLHVITDEHMLINDAILEEGSVVQYFGVLKDVYQRDLITEEIREQVQ